METQTITQTLNIIVGDQGTASGNLASTGGSLVVIIIAAAVLLTVSLCTWRLIFRRARSTKLHFRSLSIVAFMILSAAALALNLPGVLAAPTLSLGADQDALTITVPKGGGTANTTTTITTGTTNPDGYTLTAALTAPEPGIAIKLKGGDISTSTSLNVGDTPLALKTTETSSTNDNTGVTLTFTIDGTVTPGKKELKLAYAVTDNAPPAPTTMQAMTASYCENYMTIYNGSNEDAILTLTDTRGDDQTYEVAKLADGNCWMLENLKLGSTSGTLQLTPSDTDIASNFILPQVVTTGVADYDNPGVYGPVPGDTGVGATNYGYLYNWSAATAGESRTSHDETAGDAPYSICPDDSEVFPVFVHNN